MQLRPYQTNLNNDVHAEWAKGSTVVAAVLPTGGGKCLGKGTPVLMFNGEIKPVEHVKTGNKIMGPDSKCRNVLSTCAGSEQLYKITPVKGDPYIVNESHVLSLKQTGLKSKPKYNCQTGKGNIVNIPVTEYLSKSKYFKHVHKGWRCGVNFKTKDQPSVLPPYLLGIWLGDGTSRTPSVTTIDGEIISYLRKHATKIGLKMREDITENRCTVYHFSKGNGKYNVLRSELRKQNLIQNKHIPHIYKTGDRNQRLELLAGLIDSDGSYNGKIYDFVNKNETLINDFVFLARSLGFACYVKKCKKRCNDVIGNYFRCCVSGNIDEIPCKVERKKANPRKQIKSVLVTGIKVEPIGFGDYYGFEIDGDHLFMLGDFTVTHNTVCMGKIIEDHLATHNSGVCAIAHRQELVGQISNALAKYGIRHRIIGPTKVIKTIVQSHMEELGVSWYDPSAAVAVAGVDTLIRRVESLGNWPLHVGLWVIDECHHILAKNKWGKVGDIFPNARGLGVTATLCRADGNGLGSHADGLIDSFVEGPTMRELIDAGYLCDYKIYAPMNNLDLSQVNTTATGDFNTKKLSDAVHDSTVIGDVVEHYQRIAPGKLGVTFATDVKTASEISAKFNAHGMVAEVVSAKTPDALRASILRRFKRREVMQLVNVDLFGEGFDLPALEVVSMARPTQSYSLYCLDPETEILTPDGWKSHDGNFKSVIAFDILSDSLKTVGIQSRIKRKLYDSEEMYGIQSPHLDISVSDQHDMVVKGRSHTCKNWQKQKAVNVSQRKSMFTVPVSSFGDFPGVNLTTSEIHLLGWYLSDGSVNKKTNGLSVSQACNKITHINHIENTLVQCGLKYGKHLYKRKNVPETHHDQVVFTVSKGMPRGTDKHLKGWSHLGDWLNKDVPSCYDNMTREQFKELLHTLNLGDGVNNHGSLDYNKETLTITCGDNEVMADRLQAMCVTRGYRCNKATVQYEGRSEWYTLHVRDSQTATIAGVNVKDGKIVDKTYKRSRFEKLSDKPEFVWCVENELGTLITRRNGKVAIVGNCQQFGRALRIMEGKDIAIIIDHVGNVIRHGLPDAAREWSLDRREKRSRAQTDDEIIPVRACPSCTAVFERIHKICPFCGFEYVPEARNGPEFVDGDLTELNAATLAALRGDIAKIDQSEADKRAGMEYAGMSGVVVGGACKQHRLRQEAQQALRATMNWWAAFHRDQGRDDSESMKRFYFQFGIDVGTAQTLGKPDALALASRVNKAIGRMCNAT